MKLFVPALLFAVLPATDGRELATRYTERTFRVETSSSLEMETTEFRMERDGEPVDTSFGGDRSSRDVRKVVYVDKVVEAKDGQPVHVERTFESVDGTAELRFGDDSREIDLDTPLAGAKLELTRDEDGEVRVEVVEGDEPDDEAVLESMRLTLALDALLPDDAVEPGDAWALDAEAVVRALGLHISRALFAPPASDDDGEGGRRRRMGGGGGGTWGLLRDAEWSGEAVLSEGEEDVDGTPCVVIRFEIEGEAEVPDMGFGGGRQGRAWTPASAAPLPAGTFEVELEGELCFSVAEARPLRLEVEGTVTEERTFERSRGGSTMSGSVTRSGQFEHTTRVHVE